MRKTGFVKQRDKLFVFPLAVPSSKIPRASTIKPTNLMRFGLKTIFRSLIDERVSDSHHRSLPLEMLENLKIIYLFYHYLNRMIG